MTPTTDLQKPFTDEQLRDWAKTGGLMKSRAAKLLAARLIELEAENKRLREGLSGAHAGLKTAAMEARDRPELCTLYTKWADKAWAALNKEPTP